MIFINRRQFSSSWDTWWQYSRGGKKNPLCLKLQFRDGEEISYYCNLMVRSVASKIEDTHPFHVIFILVFASTATSSHCFRRIWRRADSKPAWLEWGRVIPLIKYSTKSYSCIIFSKVEIGFESSEWERRREVGSFFGSRFPVSTRGETSLRLSYVPHVCSSSYSSFRLECEPSLSLLPCC